MENIYLYEIIKYSQITKRCKLLSLCKYYYLYNFWFLNKLNIKIGYIDALSIKYKHKIKEIYFCYRTEYMLNPFVNILKNYGDLLLNLEYRKYRNKLPVCVDNNITNITSNFKQILKKLLPEYNIITILDNNYFYNILLNCNKTPSSLHKLKINDTCFNCLNICDTIRILIFTHHSRIYNLHLIPKTVTTIINNNSRINKLGFDGLLSNKYYFPDTIKTYVFINVGFDRYYIGCLENNMIPQNIEKIVIRGNIFIFKIGPNLPKTLKIIKIKREIYEVSKANIPNKIWVNENKDGKHIIKIIVY